MIIYKTTNLINGKIYIGQTNGNKKDYKGSGKILLRAIRKHGWKNFKVDILIEGNFNQKLTDELEVHYIRVYNSRNNKIGYNITPGGMGGGIRSIKSKEKARQSLIKTYKSKELRNKIAESVKKSMTAERKLKISEDLRKRVITEETREKLKLAKKNFGSKGNIKVYKNEVLVFTFPSLEKCCKSMKMSLNTIRPILNTDKLHKQYKFIRINIK